MVDIDRSVIEVAFSEPRGPLFAPDTGPVQPETPDGGAARPVADRLAVVTGAAGMLGGSLAAELAARGARVCLIGRDTDALRETVQALGPTARAAMLRCDLASAEDITSAVDFIERIGEPVDLLVHAAGLYAPSSIARGDVTELDEHYLLDVRGPYLLTQQLLPSLVRARGRVVFFASGRGPASVGPTTEVGDDVHRTITQAASASLAESLRTETEQDGVRVLTVRTDDDLDPVGGGEDAIGFLRHCAGAVLDALAMDELDVTELHLRGANRRARSERR